MAKILLFGYGNPGRGDDGLGPELIKCIEQFQFPDIECLNDMQLQVEHVMDLANRKLVLFIDADVACGDPFIFSQIRSEKNGSYTSHAMNPSALLHAFQRVYGEDGPPSFLLRIRGYEFGLGDPFSDQAADHLEAATGLVSELCKSPSMQYWQGRLSNPR